MNKWATYKEERRLDTFLMLFVSSMLQIAFLGYLYSCSSVNLAKPFWYCWAILFNRQTNLYNKGSIKHTLKHTHIYTHTHTHTHTLKQTNTHICSLFHTETFIYTHL